MMEVIEKVFGKAVNEEEYHFPSGTPIFILYGYAVSRITLDRMSCILVRPKDEKYTLSGLKKHLAIIRDICGEPVVLGIDKLSAMRRTNLIEEGISFVSGSGQIFIPGWGCYFDERISNPPKESFILSANAQVIFLYLFYHDDGQCKRVTQTQLAKELQMNKMTCSRAVRQLRELKLISVYEEGTANFIFLDDRLRALKDAFAHMDSPIRKKVYVSRIPEGFSGKICGLKALSEKTMIAVLDQDAGYAITGEDLKMIDPGLLVDEQTFCDFGGEIVEVWKYDPKLLSAQYSVDDISLILELKSEEDERIQKELDVIREKYGLEGA
ncbi:MAG: hypothetical protein J5825_04445 [Lachnospiraceae bacterium]|nr:hypothetical protein [Lachnospiraceae bacterium]